MSEMHGGIAINHKELFLVAQLCVKVTEHICKESNSTIFFFLPPSPRMVGVIFCCSNSHKDVPQMAQRNVGAAVV